MMAVRISRRGFRNREQNPKSKRSAGRRLGARRRDLCRTRSCCFKRRLSARTARVPPVPRRMASPASRCPNNTIAFFMGKQLARHWTRGQGSRIAAEGPLNYEFATHTPQARLRNQFTLDELASAVVRDAEEGPDEVAVIGEDVRVEIENAHALKAHKTYPIRRFLSADSSRLSRAPLKILCSVTAGTAVTSVKTPCSIK